MRKSPEFVVQFKTDDGRWIDGTVSMSELMARTTAQSLRKAIPDGFRVTDADGVPVDDDWYAGEVYNFQK